MSIFNLGFWWIYPILFAVMAANFLHGFLHTDGLHYSKFRLRSDDYPIFYSYQYDMGLHGLERLVGGSHPFDLQKYSKIHSRLLHEGIVQRNQFLRPPRPTEEELLSVHSAGYLETLSSPSAVAQIVEVAAIGAFPSLLVKYAILNPMLHAVGGTVLAGKAALDRGWAINLGGGFHHASRNKGEGFSVFGDITMAIRFLQKEENIRKFMIVDLDAHQGNGFERDLLNETDSVYILDAYARNNYPRDEPAKLAIRKKIELESGTDDSTYLPRITNAIDEAFAEFSPQIVFYNAGTDILAQDPLGMLSISKQGIIKRDEIVWKAARKHKVPIVMLLSGGYHKDSAEVVAESIINLNSQFQLMKQRRSV
jgi:histone deacetylase 11